MNHLIKFKNKFQSIFLRTLASDISRRVCSRKLIKSLWISVWFKKITKSNVLSLEMFQRFWRLRDTKFLPKKNAAGRLRAYQRSQSCNETDYTESTYYSDFESRGRSFSYVISLWFEPTGCRSPRSFFIAYRPSSRKPASESFTPSLRRQNRRNAVTLWTWWCLRSKGGRGKPDRAARVLFTSHTVHRELDVAARSTSLFFSQPSNLPFVHPCLSTRQHARDARSRPPPVCSRAASLSLQSSVSPPTSRDPPFSLSGLVAPFLLFFPFLVFFTLAARPLVRGVKGFHATYACIKERCSSNWHARLSHTKRANLPLTLRDTFKAHHLVFKIVARGQVWFAKCLTSR